MKTDLLLRIYKVVTKKQKIVYAPIRKHYNASTFG